MDRLPSLNAIRTFAAAARAQSFTAAAQELHVTQGAVSRMVQALELELGVLLFNRQGRFLSLTPAGQRYYEQVSFALEHIAQATRTLRQEHNEQALHLVVNSGFAIRWLMPRLPAFHQQYPHIHVHILGDDKQAAEVGQSPDLAIRYGAGNWPGMTAESLRVGGVMGVVCSPSLKGSRPLDRPADLLAGPLLTHKATTDSGFWGEYFERYGLPAPDMRVAPRYHQLLLLAEAAMAGMGFALLPLFLFLPELESKRLMLAIPHTFESARAYYVTHAPGAERDQKVHVFKTWLTQEVQKSADDCAMLLADGVPD